MVVNLLLMYAQQALELGCAGCNRLVAFGLAVVLRVSDLGIRKSLPQGEK